MIEASIVRVFLLTMLSFIVAIAITPILTHFLFKYKLGKHIRNSGDTPIYSKLHAEKSGTPTMGGIIIWFTTFVVAFTCYLLAKAFPGSQVSELNFLTRSQTFLPLGVLVSSAIVGLVDDLFNVWRWGHKGNGLRFRFKFFIYGLIAVVGAWWFYSKLDWDIVHVPWYGNISLDAWFVPFFIFVVVATAFAVNETDGLDGLAGGTLLVALAALGVIAFLEGRYDLVTFIGVIIGSLLAFLWFNIYPARFFMGDTGSISLGVTVAIIAFYLNVVFLLPIIGFIFLWEALSVIIQIVSKRLRGKKVFLSAPWHHHLQARGWPEPKIVMRLWVISGVFAVIGLIIFLIDPTYYTNV